MYAIVRWKGWEFAAELTQYGKWYSVKDAAYPLDMPVKDAEDLTSYGLSDQDIVRQISGWSEATPARRVEGGFDLGKVRRNAFQARRGQELLEILAETNNLADQIALLLEQAGGTLPASRLDALGMGQAVLNRAIDFGANEGWWYFDVGTAELRAIDNTPIPSEDLGWIDFGKVESQSLGPDYGVPLVHYELQPSRIIGAGYAKGIDSFYVMFEYASTSETVKIPNMSTLRAQVALDKKEDFTWTDQSRNDLQVLGLI